MSNRLILCGLLPSLLATAGGCSHQPEASTPREKQTRVVWVRRAGDPKVDAPSRSALESAARLAPGARAGDVISAAERVAAAGREGSKESKAVREAAAEMVVASAGEVVVKGGADARALAPALRDLANSPDLNGLGREAVRAQADAAEAADAPGRRAGAAKALKDLARQAEKSAGDLVPRGREEIHSKVGKIGELIAAHEAPKAAREARKQAEAAISSALDEVGKEVDQALKDGDAEGAMGPALEAASTVFRLVDTIDKWDSMDDKAKVRAALGSLIEVMAAAQPYVGPEIAAYKTPILLALSVLAQLFDIAFGGGGDGGDGGKGDAKGDDEKKGGEKEPGAQEPGKGGAGGEASPEPQSPGDPEGAVDQALKDAADSPEKATAGGLAGQVAKGLSDDPKVRERVKGRLQQTLKEKAGPDGRLPANLDNAASRAELIRAAREALGSTASDTPR